MTPLDNNLSRLYWQTAPNKRTIALLIFLFIAQAGASLAMPWLAGSYINTLTEASSLTVNGILLSWLGIMVFQALLGFSSSQLVSRTSIKTREKLNKLLFQRMQELPLPWFHDQEAGNILSLFNKDIANISQFIATAMAQLFLPILTFSGALIMMINIQPTVAVVLLVTTPLLFIINKLLNRHLRPLSKQVSEQHATCLSHIENWLELTPIIKAFTRENLEQKIFNQDLEKLSKLEIQQQQKLNRIGPVMRILIGISITFILYITALQVESNQITAGGLVSLLMYSALLIQPLSQLAGIYGSIQNTRASADRLTMLLSEEAEVDNGRLDMPPAPHTISFNNINFSYPDRPILLVDYCLTVQAGETLVLEAPNGSGKSTLLHMLLRYFEPQKGTITINGINIKDIKLHQLRQAIGLVPQHILLANESISANIAYGDPNTSLKQIKIAAEQALAIDFINQLPDGFNTTIGPQGVKLSGGQQQRIALARALIKQPSILLLDEATSMFDIASQKKINISTNKTFESKTIIEINHKQSS